MPVIFAAHGAPILLDDNAWMGELLAWAGSMPKPKSLLMVSPPGGGRRGGQRCARRHIPHHRLVAGRGLHQAVGPVRLRRAEPPKVWLDPAAARSDPDGVDQRLERRRLVPAARVVDAGCGPTRPGIVVSIATAGDLAQRHPHRLATFRHRQACGT
jgi:hypothetical protein